MKFNEHIAISAGAVLLVPYDAHHVSRYHEWMSDPEIQEATASEPLSLDEEYENQQSWRTSHDKLTFIVCQGIDNVQGGSDAQVVAGEVDRSERMVGDINLFLTPWQNEDDEEAEAISSAEDDSAFCVGEIDIMVADAKHRGQGIGKTAVAVFMLFIRKNLDKILEEYAASKAEGSSKGKLKLKHLMAKIQTTNTRSAGLFKSAGFVQRGEPNYFGELEMVFDDFAGEAGEEWAASIKDRLSLADIQYLKYDRSRLSAGS